MDLKRGALIISIAAFFVLFVILGADLFIEQPKYEKYCPPGQNDYSPLKYPTPLNCTAINPTSAEYAACAKSGGYIEYRYGSDGCPSESFCNTCSVEMEKATKSYNLIIFMIAVVFGSAAIIFGVLGPESIESIASGFLYGGLILLIYGTIRYADLSNKYVRFVTIVLELALVVWAAYVKIEKGREKKKPRGFPKGR
jgi:hypothetical protein